MIVTAWNVSVFGVILVRIFRHSDWIQSISYLSVFSPNARKYGPEWQRIWTLFTQCAISKVSLPYQYFVFAISLFLLLSYYWKFGVIFCYLRIFINCCRYLWYFTCIYKLNMNTFYTHIFVFFNFYLIFLLYFYLFSISMLPMIAAFW